MHALYRTQDGPNPGTKARTREAAELARAGLQDALEAIEGRVDVVGVSGYEVRQDVLLASTSPDTDKPAKGA